MTSFYSFRERIISHFTHVKCQWVIAEKEKNVLQKEIERGGTQ